VHVALVDRENHRANPGQGRKGQDLRGHAHQGKDPQDLVHLEKEQGIGDALRSTEENQDRIAQQAFKNLLILNE